ncbi:hypothetical protein [Actinomadura rubrisoli]|uniref:hypothetical protein n=1 Tax=Actinomadura rubrisoli TaxID=2530368 RepID=UPI001404EFDC|nr:hypothetical protein [Actinomadura rubrisoli]
MILKFYLPILALVVALIAVSIVGFLRGSLVILLPASSTTLALWAVVTAKLTKLN